MPGLPRLEAGAKSGVEAAQALDVSELVIKRGALSTLLREPGGPWKETVTERVEQVEDSTAAGDSYAAGYLNQRLAGAGAPRVRATAWPRA